MKRRMSRRHARGVTLVELVVSIVVIAIAGAALSGTLAYLNGTGNTSILQAQAQSIANAYLNEITGKRFAGRRRRSHRALSTMTSSTTTGSMTRWRATSSAMRPAISACAWPSWPGALNGLPAAAVRRIDVTVDYGNGSSVVATGYRTSYP